MRSPRPDEVPAQVPQENKSVLNLSQVIFKNQNLASVSSVSSKLGTSAPKIGKSMQEIMSDHKSRCQLPHEADYIYICSTDSNQVKGSRLALTRYDVYSQEQIALIPNKVKDTVCTAYMIIGAHIQVAESEFLHGIVTVLTEFPKFCRRADTRHGQFPARRKQYKPTHHTVHLYKPH